MRNRHRPSPEQRAERLAAALRDNLRKRKARAQADAGHAEPAPAEPMDESPISPSSETH